MDCKRCESRFVVRFWLGNMVELLSDNQRGKRRGHHRVLVQVHRRLVHGFAPPSGFKNGVCSSGAATWASAVQGEPGKRGQVLEEIKKWVDVSESLGAPHLRVFAGKPPAGATVQQAIGWTVDTLKAACEYAGRSITLGMKDHEGITQNADVCLEIVHGVDSPFFGINRYNQFHSYWASGRLRTDRSYRPTCNAYSYSRPLPKGGSRRP